MDYVVVTNGEQMLNVYEVERNEPKFGNILIVFPTIAIHNLFLHDIDLFSVTELVHYLNNTLKGVFSVRIGLGKLGKKMF